MKANPAYVVFLLPFTNLLNKSECQKLKHKKIIGIKKPAIQRVFLFPGVFLIQGE